MHRLDRNTSGVLLLPRSAIRAAQLSAALQAGLLRKKYLARVAGRLLPGLHTVNEPVRITSAAGETKCDLHTEGKPATTRLRALGFDEESCTTLVLCEPVTGRTHQLRLHLRHLGHPIANDPIYGPCNPPGSEIELTCGAHKRPRREGPTCTETPEDELWLHSYSYRCTCEHCTFEIEAPPPEWVQPFAPIPHAAHLSLAAPAQISSN